MLRVEGIDAYYGLSHVLQGVSLTVGAGEAVALLGRNGAGKTTTLKAIVAVVRARRGRITWNGTDITGLAVDPQGRTLYASDFTTGGVFRSEDGGESWKRLTADGLLTERVWSLGIDPAAPERVFAATPNGGLHMLRRAATRNAAGGSPE